MATTPSFGATQQFVPVKEIRNGTIILKDGDYRGILICSSINFGLKSDDEQHAIKLANQSRYGLGAAVFTQDLKRGEQIAVEEIDVGSCFVNAFVASDPRLPFGGIKRSGFGRELSQEGILEFTNIKTISIAVK